MKVALILYIFVASTVRRIGGNIVDIKEVSYIALISASNDQREKLVCGGSIITKQFILTSGYCAVACDEDHMSEVYIGTVNADAGGTKIGIGHYIYHETWKKYKNKPGGVMTISQSEFSNNVVDLGLLRTKDQIQLSDTIQPIRLPIDYFSHGTVIVTGVGIKKVLEIGEAVAYIEKSRVNHISIKSNRVLHCVDYGFPMISGEYVVGVSSFHTKECDKGKQLLRETI
ncbi:uncharacterized protein LOC129571176 isoform X1 [Sitodiplosis mosellana]|uniref:uncharacterized protein LOC129571176 isoform X1 n=1 Tax=Sitodiplosis mosellana TaxID=263140 RepID=UPI002444DA8E|nr:uncharacterized protein LOC129571176 isoform X1 [Sitodiplosis mosellana]